MATQTQSVHGDHSSSMTARVTWLTYCEGSSFHASASQANFQFEMTMPDIPHSQYSLLEPLKLVVERDESGYYVVSEPQAGVFAYDQSVERALDLFFEAYIDRFEFLTQNEGQLSSSLEKDLDNLRRILSLRR